MNTFKKVFLLVAITSFTLISFSCYTTFGSMQKETETVAVVDDYQDARYVVYEDQGGEYADSTEQVYYYEDEEYAQDPGVTNYYYNDFYFDDSWEFAFRYSNYFGRPYHGSYIGFTIGLGDYYWYDPWYWGYPPYYDPYWAYPVVYYPHYPGYYPHWFGGGYHHYRWDGHKQNKRDWATRGPSKTSSARPASRRSSDDTSYGTPTTAGGSGGSVMPASAGISTGGKDRNQDVKRSSVRTTESKRVIKRTTVRGRRDQGTIRTPSRTPGNTKPTVKPAPTRVKKSSARPSSSSGKKVTVKKSKPKENSGKRGYQKPKSKPATRTVKPSAPKSNSGNNSGYRGSSSSSGSSSSGSRSGSSSSSSSSSRGRKR